MIYKKIEIAVDGYKENAYQQKASGSCDLPGRRVCYDF